MTNPINPSDTPDLESVVEAVHATIIKSYPSCTIEYTHEKVVALVQGEKPLEIIGMLAKTILIEAKLITEEELT